MISKKLRWLVLFAVLTACHPDAKKAVNSSLNALNYAKGFELLQEKGYKTLKIYDISGDPRHFETFKLVPAEKAKDMKGPDVIAVPCKRIICLSSTQLCYFFELNDIGSIVGTNSSRHLFHKEMNRRIKEGKVKQVGKEGNFDTEMIASLNPGLIFVSPFKSGGYDALKSLGFPLVPMAAYEEETPMGRAEWVKLIAAFINKEAQADSLFNHIVARYDSLKQLTARVKYRPTVFSGKMRSGTWYVPGGNSFYARYFKDAGADYIIHDDKKAAYPLDFETMYSRAAHCDFWRLLLPEDTGYNRKALIAEDPRYGDFDAYKNGKIMMCNINKKPYYEQNAMSPDIILSDYLYFFHPELLPGYKPRFYEWLK
jgi:iron complex transport system substrate-binding protein